MSIVDEFKQSDSQLAHEALKYLINACHQSSNARSVFVSELQGIIWCYSILQEQSNEETLFLCLRILFLLTAQEAAQCKQINIISAITKVHIPFE